MAADTAQTLLVPFADLFIYSRTYMTPRWHSLSSVYAWRPCYSAVLMNAPLWQFRIQTAKIAAGIQMYLLTYLLVIRRTVN